MRTTHGGTVSAIGVMLSSHSLSWMAETTSLPPAVPIGTAGGREKDLPLEAPRRGHLGKGPSK